MIGDRWGVSDSEVLRAYPCDDFVASPVLQAWRGIRIEAPAGAVWPWVTQIRLAPYSYDWIDNRAAARPVNWRASRNRGPGRGSPPPAGARLASFVSFDRGCS